jgi:serine O-acetyltransferase
MIVADLRHMTEMWDAAPSRVLVVSALRSPLYPSIRALFWIRVSMWLWRRRLRIPAHWCKARAIRAAGVEIHPGADIGPGLALKHSVGIVVGKDVVAGRDLVIHQGVTIGHSGAADGQPRLGQAVRIGAGASVLGAIEVGDGVRVGAGALVLADVPAGTTVVGVWKGQQPGGRR